VLLCLILFQWVWRVPFQVDWDDVFPERYFRVPPVFLSWCWLYREVFWLFLRCVPPPFPPPQGFGSCTVSSLCCPRFKARRCILPLFQGSALDLFGLLPEFFEVLGRDSSSPCEFPESPSRVLLLRDKPFPLKM